jgi:hypothetical protein
MLVAQARESGRFVSTDLGESAHWSVAIELHLQFADVTGFLDQRKRSRVLDRMRADSIVRAAHRWEQALVEPEPYGFKKLSLALSVYTHSGSKRSTPTG